MIAFLVLVFFALVGNYILNHLNITFPALKIAGGIILFLISLEMLFDKRQQRKEDNANFQSVPLIAGPASIISVVVSVSNIGNNYIHQIIGMTSLALVMLVTFFSFFYNFEI